MKEVYKIRQLHSRHLCKAAMGACYKVHSGL